MNILILALALYCFTLMLLFIRTINGSKVSTMILMALIVAPAIIVYMYVKINNNHGV